ncbi:MAG TPA: RES family NAD+ phosphorylase [Longimicrobiaceae bacterium]|nr:RES family NAD+ phosphorylase [Longimicrobiaceae bacterium]
MPWAFRVCKARYHIFDGTGAALRGGRWNSPGRSVIYASTCLAGSVLEVIAHAGRMGRLPGKHHAGRALIPAELPVETVEPELLPGWAEPQSPVARAFGDRWLREARTVALYVPAVIAQPFAYNVLLNPAHSEYSRVEIEEPREVRWDPRVVV